MSSLDDKYIVISQYGAENLILNWVDFDGMTVNEILSKYFPEKQNLSFSNNLYSEHLNSAQKPSEIYPELALTDYPDQYLKPINYLSIMEDDFDFSIKFQVVCQEKDPKIKFPPLDIPFKKSNFSNCGDIFKYVSEKFTLPHLDDKFFQNSIEISPDQTSNDFFETSKKSPIFFHTTLADAAFKKINYRQSILKEIISTETTYVNDLCALIDYWKPGLKRSNYFTDQEISFFFSDLPNILKLHTKFKKSLEERGTEYDTFVSDIFLKFSSSFNVSKRFISTYAIFTYILNEKSETNKNSSTILHNLAKMNTFGGDRDFTSYLITPVQRMPRYILFLRELIKYSPPEHPDFPYLEKAMKSIVNVTQEIDLSSNSSRQISQIMSNFSKPLFVFKEGRSLIESATVYVNQSSIPFDQYSTGTLQNASAPKEGYFYLFNDSVLITTIDQISSPKSKDTPEEFSKYPENPLFHKEFHEFKYFPHADSIEFSFRDKRAKKGVNHYLIYFKKRTDCIEFLGKLEEQRMTTKTINNDDPWILWKNKYFDLRPKITSKPLNKPLKFTKILPSAYNQGASTFSETSEISHFFFGGESRDKPNGQLVSIKDDGCGTIDVDFIENNSPNIHARSGHSFCSDGTFLYVFGGRKSNSEFYDDTWRYCPSTQKWELLTPHQTKPSKRAYHASCFCHLKNNKKTITVFGGLGEKKKPLDDIAIFDIDSCEWTVYDLFNAPNPRYLMGATVCNENQFIIVGGRDERYVFNDVYSFDLDHKMWKKIIIKGETVFPRFGHQVVAIGDWAVSIGGSAFDEIFVDNNSSRSKKSKNGSPSRKSSFTFSSLPPAAVNIKTGNSFNIDEYGNAPLSLVGFGVVKLTDKSDNKISSFLAFGGLEDGINASRNSWFTVEIPNNLTELIEGIKHVDESLEKVDANVNEIQIPVNNQIISNTEEMIHVNVSEKINDEIERENLLIKEKAKNENDDNVKEQISKNECKEEEKLNDLTEDEKKINKENEEEKKLDKNDDEMKINKSEDEIKLNKTEEEEAKLNRNEDETKIDKKEKDTNLNKTDDETKLNEAEEETKINKSEQETKLNKSKEETELNKSEEEAKANKTEEEAKLNKSEEETKLNKSEEDTKLNKTEEETKLDTTEEETKLNKTEEETKINKTEEETKRNKSEEEAKLNKTEEDTKLNETEGEAKLNKTEEETKINKTEEETKINKTEEETKINKTEEEKIDQNHEISTQEDQELITQTPTTNHDIIINKQEADQKEKQTDDKKSEKEIERIKHSQFHPQPIKQEEKEEEQTKINNKEPENKQQTIKPDEIKQNDSQIQQKQKLSNEKEPNQTDEEKINNKQDTIHAKEKQTQQIEPNKSEIEPILDQKENHQSEDEKKLQIQDHTDVKKPVENDQNRDKEDEITDKNQKLQNQDQHQKDNDANKSLNNQRQDQVNNKSNEIIIQDQKDSKAEQKENQTKEKENEQKQIQTKEKETEQNENQAKEKENEQKQIQTKEKENEQKLIQTKDNKTERKQIQDPKVNNSKDIQNKEQKNNNKTNERPKNQVRKSLVNQPKSTNQNQHPQRSTQQRKSIDPKTTITTTQPKKPIQKQTQLQKQKPQPSQPPQKYQKRQTLDPNSSTNTIRRSNVKPTHQNNSPRRKTTITETRIQNKTTTKTTKTTTTTTTTQKQQVRRFSSPKPPLSSSSSHPQSSSKSTENHLSKPVHFHDSIFGFQTMISKKLATFKSNSTTSPVIDSHHSSSPPSLSDSDSLFCTTVGIDVSSLDIFGQKIVVRRLRKAIEEGTGSSSKMEKIESAFLMSLDEENSCSEIEIKESVSLLSSRMQALTDKSGKSLFLCQLDTPFDEFKDAVLMKNDN